LSAANIFLYAAACDTARKVILLWHISVVAERKMVSVEVESAIQFLAIAVDSDTAES
jgi:hypothetical protein